MGSKVMKLDLEAIEAARNGCRESLAIVMEQTKGKVFTFLYRMTLDYHLSQDLCQETMLNLIQSIQRLHFTSEEAFWAWLFRTAQGKILHHHRDQTTRRVGTPGPMEENASSVEEPVTGLFHKETMDAISLAMDALRLEYRSVIVLRCMNEMSYRQITAVLGGTQLRNKMLFFRAKRALRLELARRGLGRSHLLGALVAFASVTSLRSQGVSGASLLNAGLLKVSVPGMVLSAVTTKMGAVAAALALVLGLALGLAATQRPQGPRPLIPQHYAGPSSLLEDDHFAYPSSVISTQDPEGDGFIGINGSQPHKGPFVTTCEEILVGRSHPQDLRLILRQEQSIEVGFDGPIVEGPGPDLFYTGWYCPIIRIFLTDGAGHLYELPMPTCDGDCACFHIVPFDLSGLALPFEPKGILVQGVGDWYRYGGFELTSVRARIQGAG
jgi:RNA polymerase sigma factor (sigma-70 family)